MGRGMGSAFTGVVPITTARPRAVRRPESLRYASAEHRGSGPEVEHYERALQSPVVARRLMAHGLGLVTAVVPVSRACFYEVDPQGQICAGLVVLAVGPQPSSPEWDFREYVVRYHRSDPFAPRRHATHRRSVLTEADLGGEDALARTAYWGDFLPASGFAHQVTIFLRDGGRIVAGIALLRREHEGDFQPRELELLRSCQRVLQLGYLTVSAPEARFQREDLLADLTAREKEVARLACLGARNAEIARALTLSPATVKTHLRRVFDKLGVHSRTELAMMIGPRRYDDPRSADCGSAEARLG